MSGNTINPVNFRAASNAAAPNATVHFGSVNSGYTNNALASTHPEPSSVPGVFYSDETASGQETPTLLIVAKVNGKLLIFGGNSTLGTSSPSSTATMCASSLTDPSGATGDKSLSGLVCEPESGNFMGFEP